MNKESTYEEASKKFDEWVDNGAKHSEMPNSYIIKLAKEALSEKAKRYPVKRGRWELWLAGLFHPVCSRCRTIMPKYDNNFCPNCGADMRDSETIEVENN